MLFPLSTSNFSRENVAALAAGRYRPAAWREFFSRAWQRSLEQMAARPTVLRSLARWLGLGVCLGASLLVLSLGPSQVKNVVPMVIAWAGWAFLVAFLLTLNIGLVRREDGSPFTHFLVPNGLSAMRLMLAPLVAFPLLDWVVAPVGWLRGVALGCILALVVTDLADGWLARRQDQCSELGHTLDPLADIMLITALSIGLWRSHILPGHLLVLLLLRYPGTLAGVLVLCLTRGPIRATVNPIGKMANGMTLLVLAWGVVHRLVGPNWPLLLAYRWLKIGYWALTLVIGLNLLVLASQAMRWHRSETARS